MLLTVEGGGGLIHELERRLRVTEPVIKFLTVRIDEEQKRLDKIKAIKDAKRKAAPRLRRRLRRLGKRRGNGVEKRRWSLAIGRWPVLHLTTQGANDQRLMTND